MQAVSVQIAEAVKDHLNAGSFSWEFDCKRLAFPKATIQEADGLLVSVFSGPRQSDQLTRGYFQRQYTIYLVVQRKLSAEDAESMTLPDELTLLVEEMEMSLEDVVMAGYTMIEFSGDIERVPFNVELMRDAGIFASVIAVEYAN